RLRRPRLAAARARRSGTDVSVVSRRLRNALPVVVVFAVMLAAMYPVALLFGLPLARQRMANLNNWVRATVEAAALSDLAGGRRLEFGTEEVAPDAAGSMRMGGILIKGAAPLDVAYDLDGTEATLAEPLAEPLVDWGEPLVLGGAASSAPAGTDAD